MKASTIDSCQCHGVTTTLAYDDRGRLTQDDRFPGQRLEQASGRLEGASRCGTVGNEDKMKRAFVALCLTTTLQSMLSGCNWLARYENEYKNYADMEVHGEPGNWIPQFLPTSSRNIKERHYVDQIRVWGYFEFPSLELSSLMESCKETSKDRIVMAEFYRGDLDWWPAELRKLPTTHGSQPREFRFFLCEDSFQTYLALSESSSGFVGYFWRS